MPPGCQRGTTANVTLAGTGLGDPLAVWLGAAATVTPSPSDTTVKDSTKIRARVAVPPNAPLGMHRIRLATADGLSNFRPFCIDGLPEVAETDQNHSPAAAQLIPVPCVVTGRADAEISDFFRFSVVAGQRISFEVLGRRLGSPFDPVVRLYDASGHELPAAASDDAPGLQSDSRLSHTFAAAGDYLVEIRDTTDRGGPDFWYRLRIGEFPCAITPLPAAGKRGAKTIVTFAGPQVDGVPPTEVQVPADPAVEAVSVAPVGRNGLSGWPVTLLVSDHDELTAGEAIGTLGQAQRLTSPCGVTGRFRQKGQKDHYVIAAKKGERYHIAAQTAEIMSPAEVYVIIRDGAGV
ncbi:MAG TPA: PPC domain-containing protein, partial [Gemmataceae bacterium]|nr:PPC domain-containing protein [Gemmataceae bacterium]